MYNLVKAEIKDKEALYEIKKTSIYSYVNDIWGWDEEYQVNDFEKSYEMNDFNKIMVDSKLVGFVETSMSGDVLFLQEIHLIESMRNKGIGFDIITKLNKCHSITLGCFKTNIRAYHFYKRLGFHLVSDTETHYIFNKQIADQ